MITESYSTKTFRPLSPNGCPSILNGSTGTITVISDDIEIYGGKLGNLNSFIRVKVEKTDTFVEEIKHFISCIRRGEEPITSGEEERRTLAVVCAGYESLDKAGAPVGVRY